MNNEKPNIGRQINMGKNSTYYEHMISNNEPIPQSLTEPPFIPEVFLGREEELDTIYKKLFHGESLLLLVNGEGGIGKTSIASNYYHKYKDQYKHVAWLDINSSIADSLLSLSNSLGIEFKESTTTEERLKLLLSKMVDLEKSCLLVLDNTNDLKDLETNYKSLHCCSNFHILLTTRITEFRDMPTFPIGCLSKDDALTVFRKHYSRFQQKETDLFYSIYEAVRGNTLVLELMAKNLNNMNRNKDIYLLQNLLSDIQNKGLLEIEEKFDVETDYRILRVAKPTEIISAMFDLSKLKKPEIKLLSIFSVLPAESIKYVVLESLIGSFDNFEMVLASINRNGWIEFDERERTYNLHSRQIIPMNIHKSFSPGNIIL